MMPNDPGGHRPVNRQAYTERHHRVLLLKEVTFRLPGGALVKVKALIGRMLEGGVE